MNFRSFSRKHTRNTLVTVYSYRVLDLLKASYLRLREVMVERITVVWFGMNNKGGNGRSCFGIEVRADASKFSNMVIAGSIIEQEISKLNR